MGRRAQKYLAAEAEWHAQANEGWQDRIPASWHMDTGCPGIDLRLFAARSIRYDFSEAGVAQMSGIAVPLKY